MEHTIDKICKARLIHCIWFCTAIALPINYCYVCDKDLVVNLEMLIIETFFFISFQDIAIYWNISGFSSYQAYQTYQTLCLSSKDQQLTLGRKIVTYVGHCCDYTRFNWLNDGAIKVDGKSLYIGAADLQSDKEVTLTGSGKFSAGDLDLIL